MDSVLCGVDIGGTKLGLGIVSTDEIGRAHV